MDKRYELQWETGWSDGPDLPPERWVKAEVPGAVQLDWARAEGWGPHTYADNWKQYGWMEDKYWWYRAAVQPEQVVEAGRLAFVSLGIDYAFRIVLDGKELWRQEGMFTPVQLDLTGKVGQAGSELLVIIEPAPKREGAPVGRDQADHSCKPASSYGWDWHPRLIPLGIWDETYLEVQPETGISDAEVRYELSDTLDRAELELKVQLRAASAGVLRWRLLDPQGVCVDSHESELEGTEQEQVMRMTVREPELWWPHDHGEQPLYTSEVYFKPAAGDGAAQPCRLQRIGFRRVRLVMHEGAWKEPSQFPKSRSLPPVTVEINGRVIFSKGTNWIQPDIFPGAITDAHYRPLLDMAKTAHMNMLRIWGGCIVNKEAFFDYCNEIGLMVWQEFPLACNQYPDEPAYLRVLEQEARSIVRRLRKHPSLVLWCGGNELFNAWSRMTDQSWPLRLLNAICYEMDPQTPFLMTSPVEGMGHGHYMFQYRNGEDVLQSMPKARNTAYTEFGVPSPASVEVLRTIIPEEDLYPPRPGTAWESHHAFHALSDNMWLMADQIEHYLGTWESLEQLVAYGQLLQSEGYKCIYEEARRQKPVCSMALNWCYNEPWPTAANNSIIMWPDKPKPAYYAVQASCRPVLASARIPKYMWKKEEWFEPEMWILNDAPAQQPPGELEAWLVIGSERYLLLTWAFDGMQPGENRRGPTARFRLPDAAVDSMRLELQVREQPDWHSDYTLSYRSEQPLAPSGRSLLNFQ
ncbi:glycoside hydrolase family 2 protein [Paenibacillus sp. 1P07SE]|uniref:glycoside hydrolase family 2 protein n=1 Tax=Paenibacillus sp. 1P07SE TaxID=3132209 RepID=UPI0039A6CF0B